MGNDIKTPEKKAPTNGAAKADAKTDAKTEKRAIVKRTDADLKKSPKGKIIVVLRNAAKLANSKQLEGLTEITSSAHLSSRLNGLCKTGGRIDTIGDKDEKYTKLVDLGRAALPELKVSNYGASTKTFLNYALNELAGGGSKGFNPGVLSDIEL